jgi:hypothetical protein
MKDRYLSSKLKIWGLFKIQTEKIFGFKMYKGKIGGRKRKPEPLFLKGHTLKVNWDCQFLFMLKLYSMWLKI